MPVEWNKQEGKLIFSGELSILDAQECLDMIKKNREEIHSCERIIIDIKDLTEVDSAILQILLSLKKTFENKIFFTDPHSSIAKILKFHQLL